MRTGYNRRKKMDKTWTISIIIENEKQELIENKKYVNVDGLIPTILQTNLSDIVRRMFSDILQRMKEKKWL